MPSTQCTEKIKGIHENIKNTTLRQLRFHGFMQCDITNYESYTIIELIREFCGVVPCFFYSYDHLYLLFTHRYKECNIMMERLQADLNIYPRAPLQAKLAKILHTYYINLPWLG